MNATCSAAITEYRPGSLKIDTRFSCEFHRVKAMIHYQEPKLVRYIAILILSSFSSTAWSTGSPTLAEKIEGMLIGSAIGDAAGGPVEFVHPPLQSELVRSGKRLTRSDLETIGAEFRLIAYPKKAEPFAQWEDYAPAGTVTDDTRFKIIFFNGLQKHGPDLTQKQFAQSVLDFREFVQPSYRDNYDEWIPEIAYATNWALGKRQDAYPVERIWGGIPTMEGQMPFLPIAAINPANPEWCYKKCYELGYFDIGVAKDINSALVAGLAAALQKDGSWESMERAMRNVDPYKYNDTLYVKRELTKWLDLAHSLAKQADGSPSRLFELLEANLDTVYWWEAWVPIVVVFSIAETANYHPLACMQLTMEFGHDTDSYAQVMGAMLGAIHGKNVFPRAMRETVNRRMKEQFGQNIDDWMCILEDGA